MLFLDLEELMWARVAATFGIYGTIGWGTDSVVSSVNEIYEL